MGPNLFALRILYTTPMACFVKVCRFSCIISNLCLNTKFMRFMSYSLGNFSTYRNQYVKTNIFSNVHQKTCFKYAYICTHTYIYNIYANMGMYTYTYMHVYVNVSIRTLHTYVHPDFIRNCGNKLTFLEKDKKNLYI